MKFLLVKLNIIILVLIFNHVKSKTVEKFAKKPPNFITPINKGLYRVPNEKYQMLILNETEVKTRELIGPRFPIIVTFELFTRKSFINSELIFNDDLKSLQQSKFNSSKPTRFIIHGWLNHKFSKINQILMPALLKRDDFNVFIVDWSQVAQYYNYIWVKKQIPQVGKLVAEFLDFLNKYGGMSFDTLTLIGHSLGAHVCGNAGKYTRNGEIDTIIGLDPASPLYTYENDKERLDYKDAKYVEIIHTNAGNLGFLEPIGDTSFYPNWGNRQPGCYFDIFGICSHSRSYELYAESLRRKKVFISKQCENLTDIINKNCTEHKSKELMGGEPPNKGRDHGIFILFTNEKPPFGKGIFFQ